MESANKAIIEKLKKIVSPYSRDQIIQPDSHLTKDLALDSIDLVDIVVQIEDTFAINFHDSELDGFKTVADLVKTIENKLHAVVQ